MLQLPTLRRGVAVLAANVLSVVQSVLHLLTQGIDVISATLTLARWPVAATVTLLLTVSMVTGSFNYRTDAGQTLLASICQAPLVSLLPLCPTNPSPHIGIGTSHADFPSLMRIQNVALDELLKQSTRGTDLALHLRHAELALRDLIVDIQSSDLTIKDQLADSIRTFVVEARVAGRGLQRISSKVHGLLDG